MERACRYLKRLPKEFEVCAIRDTVRLTPACQNTAAFTEWASRNAAVLV